MSDDDAPYYVYTASAETVMRVEKLCGITHSQRSTVVDCAVKAFLEIMEASRAGIPVFTDEFDLFCKARSKS